MKVTAPGCVALAVFLAVFLPIHAHAERILVPLVLFSPEPGIGGASWETELAIWNTSDQYWGPVWDSMYCNLPATLVIPPGALARNPFCTPENTSAVLYAPDEISEEIRFQLRVVDKASPDSYGAEVPVVRESRFISGRSAILDFLQDRKDFRRTIRIINLTPFEPFRCRIRFLPYRETQEPREMFIEIPAAVYPQLPSERRISEKEIGLLEDELTKVEIIPDDEGQRYWWFGSLTNNRTNGVTILSPQ